MKKVMNALSLYFESVPDWVRQRRLLVATFFIAATVFCFMGMGRAPVDMTVEGWFEKDDPTIVGFNHFHAEFGSEDHLFLVYRAKDGDVFSPDSLAAVDGIQQELLARIRALKPGEEASLKHITKITTLMNAPVVKAEADALVTRHLVGDTIPDTRKIIEEIRAEAKKQRKLPLFYFSADMKYGGMFIETDFGAVSTLEAGEPADDLTFDDAWMEVDEAAEAEIVHEFEPTDITDYIGLMDAIKEVINQKKYTDKLEYFPVGNTATMEYNLETVTEMGMLNMLGLLIIIGLLWYLFRSFSAVIWPVSIVILSVIWTVGITGWLALPITSFIMITIMLTLTLGIANGVHLMSAYTIARKQEQPHEASLRYAYRKSATACLFSALTTMVAMLTLSLAAIVPIKIFGFMSALGVGLAFLLSIYLLPMMLDLWAPKPVDKTKKRLLPDFSGFVSRQLDKVLPMVERRPAATVGIFVSFLVLFLIGATQTRVESDPIGQFPEDSPIRKSVDIADKNMMGTQSLEIYLDLGEDFAFQDPFVLNELDKFQTDIERKYGDLVVRTTSLAEIVKDTYQTLNDNREDMYVIPQKRALISQTLFMFNNSNPEFRRKVVTDNYNKSHISVRFHNAKSSEYVKVFNELREDAAIVVAKLKTKYPDTEVTITGMLTLMMQGIEYLTHAQLESFALALVLISLFLLAVFGSMKAGAIAILPNVIPAMLVFGLLGLFDIALDFNTMMIAPVVIGIAVDDTVHFITRYRHEVLIDGDIKRALKTTIKEGGHAIVFTSLVLGFGFGVLGLATSVGTANVGIFGALAILAGLLNDLFLLPALIIMFNIKFDGESSEPTNTRSSSTTPLTDPVPEEA